MRELVDLIVRALVEQIDPRGILNRGIIGSEKAVDYRMHDTVLGELYTGKGSDSIYR